MTKASKARREERIPLGRLAAQEHENGNYSKAEEYYRILLKEHPKNDALLASLGKALLDQKKYEDAIPFLEKAIQINPKEAKATYNLGFAYHHLGKNNEALNYYEKALKIDPDLYSAHNNAAALHYLNRQYDKVIHHLEDAIKLKPDDAKAFANLALAYGDRGEVEKALELLQKALSLDPTANMAHSNYLLHLHYLSGLDQEKLFQEHLRWNSAYAAKKEERLHHANSKNANRKLRIGYISPDFRVHSVSYFFIPILKSHDKEKFEIFCYSDTMRPDTLTDHIKSMSCHWRETQRLSDEELCSLIQDDQIDILVELTGHTGDNRLKALSYKPAPIQVSYLGYPDTTGLEAMDYRITDEWADPAENNQKYYTEKLIRLPHGFLNYQAASNAPEISEPPHLKNGYITFGSFNTLQKINDQVIHSWASILKQTPNSRIILKAGGLKDPIAQETLITKFVNCGIERSRIEILPPTKSVLEHLHVYEHIDIALDTFPYNGTTTTCEALWMGVPVITFCGDNHASRVGYSIMQQTGLCELAGRNAEEFEQNASQIAANSELICHLRKNLRPHLQNSNIANAKQFSQDLEDSYRMMWLDYCGEKPTETNDSNRDNAIKITFNNQNILFDTHNFDPVLGPLIEHGTWYIPEAPILNELIKNCDNFVDFLPKSGLFALSFAGILAKKRFFTISTSQSGNLSEQLQVITANWEKSELIEPSNFVPDNTFLNNSLIHFSSLESGQSFIDHFPCALKDASPVLVISPEVDISNDCRFTEQCTDLKYHFFRFVPAVNKLCPIIFSSGENTITRSSFVAIKEERLIEFYNAGLLLFNVPAIEDQTSNHSWIEKLLQLPYAAEYVEEWKANSSLPLHNQYIHALNLYFYSKTAVDLETNYAALLWAFERLIPTIDQFPTLPRLLTAARIGSELGLRDSTTDILQLIIAHFQQETTLELDEPFLSPLESYENINSSQQLDKWILAATLESLERHRSQSFFNSSEEDINRLHAFGELGIRSQFMEKRLSMINKFSSFLAENSSKEANISLTEPTDKKNSIDTKPDAAILYHLARTGGTLISKCLGCIEGNTLLSEIHPVVSVMSPLEQAYKWFKLFTEEEYEEILKTPNLSYPNLLKLIGERAISRNKHLIIRDWSHIDFTAVPFVNRRSNELTQTNVLKDYFNIRQIATVRHPIDSFLSLSKLAIMQGKLDIPTYLEGCKAFADKANSIGFIRYEDFCAAPQEVLKFTCDKLNVAYDDSFMQNYSTYSYITGEVTGGRSAGEQIRIPKRRDVDKDTLRKFEEDQNYWDILKILGYEN